ncbi:MAG TPA: hypothetical protein VFY59_16770 [Rubrobacter sp.]|jgi:hypothetical protein|nr:hypothetical protein [Rubrobacter sp.]
MANRIRSGWRDTLTSTPTISAARSILRELIEKRDHEEISEHPYMRHGA